MANIKKLISIILSIAVVMVLFAGTASADNSNVDIEQMAAALNRLNILQGSGGDYMLYENLQRSQGVAFIIRMLGKEDYVKEHAEELKSTPYPDVAESAWYASYVGYSTEHNIVGGYLDGTFLPSEYTTEKAFLKMALCALGYEYSVDFDWTNVYKKAYEVGIVTDTSYSERIEDDTDYLRIQAIQVIYRALNTYKKGTQTKMIMTLVDEGLFTRDEVVNSEILSDDIVMSISSVTALSPTIVEVEMNEGIQSVSEEDISIIYDASDVDRVLEIKSLEINDVFLRITTESKMSDDLYIIEIENVEDLAGNISGRMSATFKGFTTKEIKSDFFKISKVEQVSANILHVYFTHPVNASSEIPNYYEIFKEDAFLLAGTAQNMTVKKLQSEDNVVSIYLNDSSFEQGGFYTIQVSGKLMSGYGVRLNEGYGDSYDFVITESGAEPLKISTAHAWSSDSVRIVFNREVDPGWAGKRLNYSVYDSDGDEITVTNVTASTGGKLSGREVLLNLSGTLSAKEDYELHIDYIPDLYKQSAIENLEVQFSGSYSTSKALSLTSATSTYNNSVLLTFNNALDLTEALDIDNYRIEGASSSKDPYRADPVKVRYLEADKKYTVRLYMDTDDAFIRSKKYTVNIYNMLDSLGNPGKSPIKGSFTGGRVLTEEWISDAVTVSKDSVKVTFETEIAFVPENLNVSNYMLEYEKDGMVYKMAPIGLTYVDANTLVLRFDELDSERTYKLGFIELVEYSGEYTMKGTAESAKAEVRWGK